MYAHSKSFQDENELDAQIGTTKRDVKLKTKKQRRAIKRP